MLTKLLTAFAVICFTISVPARAVGILSTFSLPTMVGGGYGQISYDVFSGPVPSDSTSEAFFSACSSFFFFSCTPNYYGVYGLSIISGIDLLGLNLSMNAGPRFIQATTNINASASSKNEIVDYAFEQHLLPTDLALVTDSSSLGSRFEFGGPFTQISRYEAYDIAASWTSALDTSGLAANESLFGQTTVTTRISGTDSSGNYVDFQPPGIQVFVGSGSGSINFDTEDFFASNPDIDTLNFSFDLDHRLLVTQKVPVVSGTVPEPGTVALLCIAVLAMGVCRHRSRMPPAPTAPNITLAV